MNTDNNKFLEKVYGQTGHIPSSIRQTIEDRGQSIELYGMSDLESVQGKIQFTEDWIILTEKRLLIFKMNEDLWQEVKDIAISKLVKIKEVKNMSLTTLIFIEADDMPPLAEIRYTNRQKVCMENIKYLLEQRIETDHLDGKFTGDFADNDNLYASSVLKNYVEAQNNDTQKKAATLWRLLSYLKPYKKPFLMGTFGAVCGTIVKLMPALLTGYLIDKIIKPFQGGELNLADAQSMAWLLVGSIALLGVVNEFFIWLRLNKMSIMGEWVAKDLREELYGHLQKLGLDFYSSKQTGSIISRVSSDTDRIWDFIAFGVVEVGIAMITLLGLSSVLIYLDWKLGLVMTLPVPLLLFSIYLHGEKMQKLFLRAWRKWSDVTNVLSDTIPGIQVVKAFGQEKKESKRFNKSNAVVTSEFEGIHEAWTKFWPLLMLGVHGILMVTWALAVPRLLENEASSTYLTAGTFVSFLLYMTMFSQPIEVIGQMARMLNRALSSAYRIFEILDTQPTMHDIAEPKVVETIKGEVEFKNVQFSYDGVRRILKDISFKVQPGEMIGLVGQSGGGKSTITKLISRFFDVTKGEILIDGCSVKDLERSSLRRNIGMVLQDPYLFHGTLLDNIRYGCPTASLKQVIEAAKAANAHEFIIKMPHAYQTTVGERGHTLSGGERQRVSIARALLNNPRILILDEATSAVDTETERKIQDALDKLVEGRTVFAIAHRLSTLRQADRIFVIEDGKIVEQGTHPELLAQDGTFKKLCTMQEKLGDRDANTWSIEGGTL